MASLEEAAGANSGGINHLPAELLLYIFEAVRDCASPSSLLRCALVSRSWSTLSLPILYEHITVAIPCQSPIRYKPHLQSLAATGRGEDWGERIASFTLLLDPCTEAYETPPARLSAFIREIPPAITASWRHEGFTQSSEALGRMRNLTTLSIKARPTGIQMPWTPQPGIFNTIKAIGSTVVNLEIDTLSSDIAAVGTSPVHICHAVAPLLPQLKHLRLRIRFVCCDLFSTLSEGVTSPLEKLSIRFGYKYNSICYPEIACTKRCGGSTDAPPHDARINLARRSRHLFEAGKFPNITAFTLVDRHDLPTTATFADSRAFKVYDVIDNHTVTIPWRAMPSPPAGVGAPGRYYAVRVPEPFLRCDRLADELPGDRTELIANDLELLGTLVERQEWCTGHGEARLPLSVLRPRDYPAAQRRRRDPYAGAGRGECRIFRPSEYRGWLDTVTEPIWLLETAIGATVLEARVQSGFNDTSPGSVRMPEGLRYEYDRASHTLQLETEEGQPGVKIMGWSW